MFLSLLDDYDGCKVTVTFRYADLVIVPPPGVSVQGSSWTGSLGTQTLCMGRFTNTDHEFYQKILSQ